MTTALEQAFPGTSVSNATMIARMAEQALIAYPTPESINSEDFSIQPWAGVVGPDGAIFMYDATDTTSAHDGTTVLVVSGRRYILQSDLRIRGVVASQGDTAPPGSPSFGDQYIIGASPSGAWASYAKYIATYTARGWIYTAPYAGLFLWVTDEDTYYHYSESDTWLQGMPVSGISDGALTPLKFRHPLALLVVEDVRNAPPGSIPSDGTAYVIDTSPTGAFSGHAGDIAYVDNGAYVFIDPFEGATVYDKDQGFDLCYRSGAWERKVPASRVPNAVWWDTGTVNLGTFGNGTTKTLGSVSLTGGSTSAKWRLELNTRRLTNSPPAGGLSTVVARIFVDAEASPRYTVAVGGTNETTPDEKPVFYINVPDTASHTLAVKVTHTNTIGVSVDNVTSRTIFAVTEIEFS